MIFKRLRYVLMRKDRSEIWCGGALKFVPLKEVGYILPHTYQTEMLADKSGALLDSDYEVVPCVESVKVNVNAR